MQLHYRNARGQFKKKIGVGNILLLIMCILLIAIPVVHASGGEKNTIVESDVKGLVKIGSPEIVEKVDPIPPCYDAQDVWGRPTPTPKPTQTGTPIEGKQEMTCAGIDCTTPKPTTTPVPLPKVKQDVGRRVVEIAAIMRHVKAYGGKWTQSEISRSYDSYGYHRTKVMVAISVAETSMGKKTRFKYNYLNYGMKSFGSVDKTVKEFQVGMGGMYKNLIVKGKVNRTLAGCYVYGCKTNGIPYNWIKIVEWSYSKM